MKRITGYLRWLVPTALIVGLVPLGGAIASAADAPAQGGSATLNASGATFPQAYYEEVIGAFKQKDSNVTINYAGGGSGKGGTMGRTSGHVDGLVSGATWGVVAVLLPGADLTRTF